MYNLELLDVKTKQEKVTYGCCEFCEFTVSEDVEYFEIMVNGKYIMLIQNDSIHWGEYFHWSKTYDTVDFAVWLKEQTFYGSPPRTPLDVPDRFILDLFTCYGLGLSVDEYPFS